MPALFQKLGIILGHLFGDWGTVSAGDDARNFKSVNVMERGLLRVQLPHDDSKRINIGF